MDLLWGYLLYVELILIYYVILAHIMKLANVNGALIIMKPIKQRLLFSYGLHIKRGSFLSPRGD